MAASDTFVVRGLNWGQVSVNTLRLRQAVYYEKTTHTQARHSRKSPFSATGAEFVSSRGVVIISKLVFELSFCGIFRSELYLVMREEGGTLRPS